ncbi:hypothetical protein QQF64_016559 [Cirrhinus molitorella]|uniref:Uncharacterized protein n=1 Tax=Cirrhinus molitorella TaxID=172907 RepID=A0ABR3LN52_9TELE
MQADLEKTINDSEARLEEVRNIVLSNLWSRYGKDEMETAIQEAERACERAAEIPVIAVNRDGYEFQLDSAKGIIHGAIRSLAVWEMWIPAAEKPTLEARVKNLKACSNNLEARKVEFITAQRVAEDERDRVRVLQMPMAAPQPTLRIKPTSLPKFSGCKINFHRWKRDWENLQKQGEPTGSVEVK